MVAPATPSAIPTDAPTTMRGKPDLLDDELLGAGELAGVEADEREDDGCDVADGDVDGAEAEGDERAGEDEQAEHGAAHRQAGVHPRLTISLKRGNALPLETKMTSSSSPLEVGASNGCGHAPRA